MHLMQLVCQLGESAPVDAVGVQALACAFPMGEKRPEGWTPTPFPNSAPREVTVGFAQARPKQKLRLASLEKTTANGLS